jgi:uncharacterized short protein YbdD (DUF466 family)
LSGGAVTPVTLRENRREDGTVYPLGTEDAAKLAAARLAGVEKYSMYVIEERNVAPDRLESLRKALEQRHAAGN